MRKFDLQLFSAADNTTLSTDLAPAISIDCVSKLHSNIDELRQVLGISEMEAMPAGAAIKIYKMTQSNTPDQVDEGETIALTEIKRELVDTIDLILKKYRKNTTAEAIQKVGREIAINQTDEKLISGIQKSIKADFYTMLGTGLGTAGGVTFQSAISDAWGKIKEFYADEDASPIYFVSAGDAADYLGNAQITLQQAFGLSYVSDFLGLGTLVVSPSLEKGTVIATAKENLHGAYVPAVGGDIADVFNLTADDSGLVGMTHQAITENATVDTLVFSGVAFYPELLDGVFLSTIYGESDGINGLNNLTVSSSAGTASGDTAITVSPALTSGNSYKYKVADDVTLPAYGQSVRNWTSWDGSSDITAATGKEICIVECDANYKAIKGGVATVTAHA